MKNIYLIIVLIYSLNNYSQNFEIKNTIVNFFEAFHKKDTLKLKQICHPLIKLQTINEGAKRTTIMEETKENFINTIALIPKEMQFEERILKYSIQIDGTMAHVWTPYEFYIDNKLSHTGVNSFTLFFENNKWRIVHLMDTRRK